VKNLNPKTPITSPDNVLYSKMLERLDLKKEIVRPALKQKKLKKALHFKVS